MHIDTILSPDLQLAERRHAALQERLEAANQFKPGDRVKAGIDGKPGVLIRINDDGMATIRWDCGSVLSGVEASNLHEE